MQVACGCVPQPSDSVPPQAISHAVLASGGQQLRGGGAAWATVDAHHLPRAGMVEDLQLCPRVSVRAEGP